MKLRFSGLENPLVFEPGKISVLEVEASGLFARICQSLVMEEGAYATEAYSLWDDQDKEQNPKNTFLYVPDPFNLPWEHRVFSGKLYETMQAMMYEDENLRKQIEDLHVHVSSAITSLSYQMNAEYVFGLEWDLRQYLKGFKYQANRPTDESLIDNLIQFIDYCVDMHMTRPLMFFNLKTFLNEKELSALYERVFFHKISLFLLENAHDQTVWESELKLHVDQQFLES